MNTTNNKHSLTADRVNEVKALNSSEQAILQELLSGGAISAKELTLLTDYRDPRGIIRYLRKKGYEIFSYWVCHNSRRYKEYTLQKTSSFQLNLFE